MSYRIWRSPRYLSDIAEFGSYCAGYHPDFAITQFDALDHSITQTIATMPLTWSYFIHTGAPYRAYLHAMGRRSKYWIVYSVDEAEQQVNILRFWNASRDPRSFEL